MTNSLRTNYPSINICIDQAEIHLDTYALQIAQQNLHRFSYIYKDPGKFFKTGQFVNLAKNNDYQIISEKIYQSSIVYLAYKDECVILLNEYNKDMYSSTRIEIYYKNRNTMEKVLDELIQAMTPCATSSAKESVFTFTWSTPTSGVQYRNRKLKISNWDDIQFNYHPDVVSKLDNLFLANSTKLNGGKLILLHGPAGTGKSHTIRALSSRWRDWAHFYYIMDPNIFFTNPAYIIEVLMHSDDPSGPTTDQFNVIIAEDTDEFLRADAKSRTGQGLSMLLNTTDGIVGQGLNTLFIITTNEPMSSLHPAIIRPGRCMANIEYKPLSIAHARQWLIVHNIDPHEYLPDNYRTEITIAELYDILNNVTQNKDRQIKQEKKLLTGQFL